MMISGGWSFSEGVMKVAENKKRSLLDWIINEVLMYSNLAILSGWISSSGKTPVANFQI